MSSSPVDQVTYHNILKKTKRRRAFFFGTLFMYIPAVVITYQISPTNRTMGTLFGCWVVILIVSTVLVSLCKCPRCGNYFHLHGITLLVLRRCLHCQLHISSDTVPE
jgi:hypothetical protein